MRGEHHRLVRLKHLDLGLTGYVRDNYRARITRLEAMQHQLYGRAKEVAAKETGIATQAFGTILQGSYGATLRDYGAAAFAQLDDRTVDLILRTPFQGSSYSQRIWGNTDALAEKVSGLLGRGAATGESLSKLTREVREAFDVSKGQAERLMRTESNHFRRNSEHCNAWPPKRKAARRRLSGMVQ